MSLRLIIEDDEGSTTVVPLASDAITIGRQQGNTIQLTEKNVSRRHARLAPEPDGWVIEDLGSYNGIKVNNDAIDGRTKLREGDVVEIGDYHLAITEDVDKSPLNFRTGQAANNGVVEPMLVSSSADLPRLSAEEIAVLSGQQPLTPPGMMVDSGPSLAAGHYRPQQGAYGEPERSKKTGLFVFLGIVVLGLAAIAVFWVINGDKDGEGSGEVAAGAGKGDPKTATKAVAPVPTPNKPDPTPADGGTPVPPSDDGGTPADGGAVADSGAVADDGAVADGEDPTADDGDDDDVEVVDDDPTPNRPKPPKTPKQQKTPKQPDPAIDVDQMISDARKLVYKQPDVAYRMAKQAYAAKASSDALWVMGPAACRLKDKSKADYVLKRLKGADKTKLKDMCAQKGFEF